MYVRPGFPDASQSIRKYLAFLQLIYGNFTTFVGKIPTTRCNYISNMPIKLYDSDISTEMPLPYADDGIQAGFPSPAQDYISESIDLNRDLIKHPASTFYGRVVGDSMSGEGIYEGDILIIDKSIEPCNGDLAVCCLEGEFTLKRLRFARNNRVFLMPSNPRYSPIEVTGNNDFSVWGIVLYTIKSNRRANR